MAEITARQGVETTPATEGARAWTETTTGQRTGMYPYTLSWWLDLFQSAYRLMVETAL